MCGCHLIFTKVHKQFNGESIAISAVLKLFERICKTWASISSLPLYINQLKINYKSNFKIIKLLEENLHDVGLSKVFLDRTPKAVSITKVGKWEFIKIRYLCSSKDTIQRIIQATDWEKIFANHMSNKGLVSKIYKELSKLTSKETI